MFSINKLKVYSNTLQKISKNVDVEVVYLYLDPVALTGFPIPFQYRIKEG